MKKLIALSLVLILALGMLPALAYEDGAHLVFTFWGSPIEKEVINAAMKDFEEAHPGVTVESVHVPNEYDTKMQTMAAAGEAPDTCYMSIPMAFAWAKEGELVNVYDRLADDPVLSKDDFVDGTWYEWEEGKAFGSIPAIEPFGVFYNKDMFDAAGVEYPSADWTWDDFIAIAKKLTVDASGKHPDEEGFNAENIVQYGAQISTGATGYISFVWSNGGDYFNEDHTKFALTEPAATEAIQKIADAVNVEHVAPSPIQAKAIPSPVIALQSNMVAMYVGGQWNCLDLGDSDMNFDLVPLPQMGDVKASVMQGGTVVTNANSKYPDAAWELWKWMYSPDSVLNVHARGLWMPVQKAWLEEEELLDKWALNNKYHPSGFKATFIDSTLEYGRPFMNMYMPNFDEIEAIVAPALDNVWLGETTAAEALASVEADVNAILAK
ncbi:MAG: sugar ABC transporter substrate-binding protein [Clostridia bacterium]|nr:sugar ABC transporter substrate-binding protein [Clostridia bacterium]